MKYCALLFSVFLLWGIALHAQLRVESAKPWMGVAIAQGKTGVLVENTIIGTPAEKAGLLKGDEILSVNDLSVKTPLELIDRVSSFGIGYTVKVDFLRNNVKKSVMLQLVLKPEVTELLQKFLLNQKAPDFTLPVIFGPVSGKLQDLRGKVVILKFWGTWCPACRAALPVLDSFAAKYPEITVLAISDEDESTLKSFFGDRKPHHAVLSSKDKDTSVQYHITAFPTLVVIDRMGVIKHVTIGGGVFLEESLKKALSL